MLTNLSYAEGTNFGIGAEIDSRVHLYFPIDIGNIIIEPGLAYSSHDRAPDSATTGSNVESKNTEISLGIFKKNQLSNKTLIYYGARIGLLDRESTSNYASLDGSSGKTSSQSDGYMFAPTFSAQYLIGNDFHIGLDLSLRHTNTDGHTTSFSSAFGGSESSIESTDISTKARVILRYYF